LDSGFWTDCGNLRVIFTIWLHRASFFGSVFTIMRPSEALATHRAALRQLISRHGLARPRVFGSVLTGSDTEQSDLDLLVDPSESTSLFTIAGLQIDAEKLTGVTVSVSTPDGLPPKFRDQVLRQAEPL
jgi:predicted nucleotidyltransferase